MAFALAENGAYRLTIRCVDGRGDPKNLTGNTVKLRWRSSGGVAVDRAAQVISAADGLVRYDTQPGEIMRGTLQLEGVLVDNVNRETPSANTVQFNVRGRV